MTTAPANAPKIDPAKPLDSVLTSLIADARALDRGFALHMAAEGGDRSFCVEQLLPPIDEWRRPVDLRCHVLEDVASLIAFAQRYGSAERSAVCYTDTEVVLVVDDTIERGDRERITTRLAFSTDWTDWSAIFGREVEHRKLLEFLLVHQQNLAAVQIIDAMRKVRATSQVKLDSDLRVESDTVGVVFTATAGEELLKFPREIDLRIPVLDIDVDRVEAWANLTVRVEIRLPTEPKQPVRFILLAPTAAAVRRRRVNTEVQILRDALPGWLVMRGAHLEERREIGRPDPESGD